MRRPARATLAVFLSVAILAGCVISPTNKEAGPEVEISEDDQGGRSVMRVEGWEADGRLAVEVERPSLERCKRSVFGTTMHPRFWAADGSEIGGQEAIETTATGPWGVGPRRESGGLYLKVPEGAVAVSEGIGTKESARVPIPRWFRGHGQLVTGEVGWTGQPQRLLNQNWVTEMQPQPDQVPASAGIDLPRTLSYQRTSGTIGP